MGEVIPLVTLTHELGAGADWPAVGDWERVTTDLLHLLRFGDCDALRRGGIRYLDELPFLT